MDIWDNRWGKLQDAPRGGIQDKRWGKLQDGPRGGIQDKRWGKLQDAPRGVSTSRWLKKSPGMIPWGLL